MVTSFWIPLIAWCALMGVALGPRRGAVAAHLGLGAVLFFKVLLWVDANPGALGENTVVLLIQPLLCLATALLVGLIAHKIKELSQRPEPFYAAFASCVANTIVVLPFLR